MSPSISPDDDGLHIPTTPSKTSRTDTNATKESPAKNDSISGASGSDATPVVVVVKPRLRANSKKEPPTLLTDFLRGKQSAARMAAERKRRHSIEMVKAELRQEMRQSSVRRLQQPGGVRDRVQKWQKAHTAAMLDGDPDDAATEPTDVAFKGEDEESVTESDRVRIKWRQKKRSASKPKPPPEFLNVNPSSSNRDTDGECATSSSSPPKKRVVSDEHWRKPRARRSPSRRISPSSGRPPLATKGLPSDFVQKSGGNPLVSNKVKEWAAKVEVPDAPPLARSHRSHRSGHASARSEGAKSEAGDSASDITARWVTKQKKPQDRGIRAKSSSATEEWLDDDGVRVTKADSITPRDDNSRASEMFRSNNTPDRHTRVSRSRSKTTSGSGRPNSPSRRILVTRDPTELSQQTGSHVYEGESKTRATEQAESIPETPTNTKNSVRRRTKTKHSDLSRLVDESSCLSEQRSNLSSVCHTASDLASSLANKSIADISGDIPFGHSAFSELDLTIEGQPKSRPKRPKVDHNTSLKSMPKVFKKVVEESKKIIHEMNEPPRHQVANNPPSIEKWLNNTVDPFVDPKPPSEKPSPPSQLTKEPLNECPKQTAQPRRRSSHGTKLSHQSSTNDPSKDGKQVADDAAAIVDSHSFSAPGSAKSPTSPTSTGLRRTRATRSNSSPLKQSNSKRQILGVLKEAFQGESNALSVRPKSYQGSEQRKFSHAEDVPPPLQIRKSMSSPPRDDATNSTQFDGREEASNFKLAAPRFRPPTRGDHELSTILSEESSSAVDSDLSSDVTQSTLTQSTILTKDSETSRTSKNHAPGLKRRLTKHSDLVSVLSLPDDSSIPNTIKSNRSRPSLRKHRSASGDATAQELLREFIDDENLYVRELKTLVDGVVPVLLSHVVNGTNATDLFGPSTLSSGKIPDNVSRSVVNMGVALEKLKSAHKKAPTSDIRRMANWAHGVVPMYNSYLTAWRLGFDDIVVNLAPAGNGLDDDESLLAALPRNEKGDVINENGERVAVAYLLKRPLIRVKQLVKLIKCVDTIVASSDTRQLLRDFENLQDKARRRFKEESARIIDEEAICTDTSRCRDLGTLESSSTVAIDPARQVSAKDVFSLSLLHSNSQRLDCQVELVHRDNQKDTTDSGDLLIRETGDGRRSYLLFPPVAMTEISARTGQSHYEMVVMIRGTSQGRMWREFLTLTTDNEDQILDWLDILPLQPVPPMDMSPIASSGLQEPTTPTKQREPLTGSSAERSMDKTPRSPIAKDVSISTPTSPAPRKSLPIRYRQRASTMERATSPVDSSGSQATDFDRTPTKEGRQAALMNADRGRPLKESMRPDFTHLAEKKQESQPPNSMPYRKDGAPPPPIHRTLSTSPKSGGGAISKSAPCLQPPPDIQGSDRLKRRTSSPLKHEYLPSDQSSTSEAYSTGESDGESSDDEIESIDIPETELGVSIQSDERSSQPHAIPRFMPESECSLTPSNSASQAGLHNYKNDPNDQASRFTARISRWSDKGAWKDILSDPCSIVVRDGLIEAYAYRPSADPSDLDPPVLALDLTPLVLIRQSTAVDLEIRSSVQSHSRLYQSYNRGNFRFRCFAAPDCYNLYMSVHQARLNNQKFIQLENEARFKSFGERQSPENDGDTSSRRRSWFGRKNSYRSSVRAPSQSHDGASTTPSSTPSASSFLKRLTVNGNLSFNLARSSVDRRSRAGSGENSLYTSESSSASGTPPRSPAVSVENSGHHPINAAADNIRIRLHLLVTSAKWEDYGNCSLQIRRPPPGWRQALRANHGLEKRVTVTTLPKKDSEEPKIVLDAVLGSGCFSSMGSRGIVCGVWEEVKNGDGVVGMVPDTGATGGNIKKWCFQFANAAESNGVLRLVHQEVLRA